MINTASEPFSLSTFFTRESLLFSFKTTVVIMVICLVISLIKTSKKSKLIKEDDKQRAIGI